MARRERAREGLGLMGVGGGVFAVAAFAAAVASPLAGELTSAIRQDVAPVAQASVEAAAASGSTAVRVLRMPPLPLLPGESVLGVAEAGPHGSARAFGLSQRALRRPVAPGPLALATAGASSEAASAPVAEPAAPTTLDTPGNGRAPSTANADRSSGRGKPSGQDADSAQTSTFSIESTGGDTSRPGHAAAGDPPGNGRGRGWSRAR